MPHSAYSELANWDGSLSLPQSRTPPPATKRTTTTTTATATPSVLFASPLAPPPSHIHSSVASPGAPARAQRRGAMHLDADASAHVSPRGATLKTNIPWRPVPTIGVTSAPGQADATLVPFSTPFLLHPPRGRTVVPAEFISMRSSGTTHTPVAVQPPNSVLQDAPRLIGGLDHTDVSSADASGEDEVDEICVDQILRPTQADVPRHAIPNQDQDPDQDQHSACSPPLSPLTPSPHSPHPQSLFTPPSSPKRPKSLPYVAVPSFPSGSSRQDYPCMTAMAERRAVSYLTMQTQIGEPGPVRAHPSLSAALKAAMEHNAGYTSPKPAKPHPAPAAPTPTPPPAPTKRKYTWRSWVSPDHSPPVRRAVKKPRLRSPSEDRTTRYDPTPVPHDQTQSIVQLHVDMVDPLDPPPTPYAALLLSTRHLWLEGHWPEVPGEERVVVVACRSASGVGVEDLFPRVVLGGHGSLLVESSTAITRRARPPRPNTGGARSVRKLGKQKAVEPVSPTPSAPTPSRRVSSPGPGVGGGRFLYPSVAFASIHGTTVVGAPSRGEFFSEQEGEFLGSPWATETGAPYGSTRGQDPGITDPARGVTLVTGVFRQDARQRESAVGADAAGASMLEDIFLSADLGVNDRGPVHPWVEDGLGGDFVADPRCGDARDGIGTIDPSLLGGVGPMAPQVSTLYSPTVSRSVSPLMQDEVLARDEEDVGEESGSGSGSPGAVSGGASLNGSRRSVPGASRPRVWSEMPIAAAADPSDDGSSSGSDWEWESGNGLSRARSSRLLRPEKVRRGSGRVRAGSGGASSSRMVVKADVRSQSQGGSTELTFCHHCRRTTLHKKMRCAMLKRTGEPCGKRYCTVCISKRYPDITFDSSCSTFECPACQNVCNCSVCSRKRGEIYYGERTGGLPNAKAKARKAALLPLDPGVPIPVPAQANTYWATVYGLSGEKVGTAFVGEDGNDRVVVARPVQAQSAMRAERVRVSRRARVFVGRVQEAWGLGMWRVRDLEAVDTGKGKGKGKGVEGVAGRMYVGKKWLLGVPLRSHSCVSQPVEWTLERVSSPLLSDGEEEREREEEDCERGRMPGSEHEEDRVDVGVSLGEQAVEYAIRSAFAQLLLRPVDAE